MTLTVEQAERAGIAVGVVTLGVGLALFVAPRRTGEAAGVQAERGLRVVGLLDVVVAIGVLWGRPRWPWLAARSAANPPTAAYFAMLGRRSGAKTPVVIAAVILCLTIADASVGRVLRAAKR